CPAIGAFPADAASDDHIEPRPTNGAAPRGASLGTAACRATPSSPAPWGEPNAISMAARGESRDIGRVRTLLGRVLDTMRVRHVLGCTLAVECGLNCLLSIGKWWQSPNELWQEGMR
ncbi:MAG: hypothetical protein ABJH34_02815, partial [Qipengyuania citrea]|uniref:hypothetical protein n=1 Tax=Qipengyuania citrea TaxID=225971 RepID=UPI003299C306